MNVLSLSRKTVAIVSFALAAHAACAVAIDSSDLLGTAKLANSNESSEFDGLNYLVDLYNGVAAVKPASVTSATLKLPKTLGATVPAPTGQASQIAGNDKASITIDLGGMTYDWLMAKWANTHVYYYIGGVTGTIELTNDVVLNANNKGKGLSHYALFNGKRVPDASSTMALLALGLGAIGCFARRRTA